MALRQQIKYPLETLHPVAVARDQPATNSVGGSPESVELGFKDPIGMINGSARLKGLISVNIAQCP
jgi:hypothetical protein